MGKVRPFLTSDVCQVEQLHARAFADSNRPPAAYFEEVFFQNPWFNQAMPSLVYEEDDGRIVGFLGVVPRFLSFRGQKINAAIMSHLMVDRTSRSTTAVMQLLQAFFGGPQDLAMADLVTNVGRKAWEAFKSETVWAYSMQWTRVLRPSPSRRLRSILKGRKSLSLVVTAARPLWLALDAIDERVRGSAWRPARPPVTENSIDESVMVENARGLAGRQCLRPEYDKNSMRWLLERAANKKQQGVLQKIGVQNQTGEYVGWYVYYLKPKGSCRVLQIAARKSSIGQVLDSLFYHAWRGGGTSVYGRLEPQLIEPLASKSGISYRLPGYWLMVRSRDSELLSVIHRGDASISELEGEWTTGFHGEG